MSRLSCLSAVVALPVALSATQLTTYAAALDAASPAGPAPTAVTASAESTRCEVRVYKRGGGTTVEGVVFAGGPISGSFRLSVRAAAGVGADSDQSGSFSASPNGATSLGELTVTGGPYAAEMTVRWSGGSTSCAQHVGKG